jgi:glycosyltransferase involved in cell wall biosynthesis
VTYIPCPIRLDQPIQPVARGAALVSAFHLRNYRNKNLARIVAAFRVAKRRDASLTLRIVGGGDASDLSHVGRIVAPEPAITLVGAVPNSAMPQVLNNAAGFVMPSLSESFGMVFLEALFCGCPIIYPTGRAVDGYFNRSTFAIAVDPRDPAAIAEAMLQVVQREVELKHDLARWQMSGEAQQFQRKTIAATFASAIHRAAASSLATTTHPPSPTAEVGSTIRSSGI